MDIDDISLFHKITLEREMIQNKYKLLSNINNRLNLKSTTKSTGHLPRNKEDQCIYFKNNDENGFKFNNYINIDKNKLMTFFLCNNYDALFSLIELYISYLFNGYNIEKIQNLFEKELISDSIFINVLYCINIINYNKKSYNKILLNNINNRLVTTEIMIKLDEFVSDNPKSESLFLILKFIDLLKSIDVNGFNKEIEKLEEIFQRNNNNY